MNASNLTDHQLDRQIFNFTSDYSFPDYQTFNGSCFQLESKFLNDKISNINSLFETTPNHLLPDSASEFPCSDRQAYLQWLEDYMKPKTVDWIIVVLHVIVFIVGISGNFLICSFVYRNQSMRTVTNFYIVNLAIADFLVILICLPPTVTVDVIKYWPFGKIMCKIVTYFQDVSVSVSVYTLTFISIDRWWAICRPLKSKSGLKRTRITIILIWLFSLIILSPETVYLDLVSTINETDLYLRCDFTWSEQASRIHQLATVTLLYLLPISFMSVAYYRIALVLWDKNIPGSDETRCSNETYVHDSHSDRSRPKISTCRVRHNQMGNSCANQIQSRRKVAKMLIAVVVVFGLCFLPVHTINTLRVLVDVEQNDLTAVLSLVAHWLCYANSAINPVIYNFMSGKFRREFRATFMSVCGLENCGRKRRQSSVNSGGKRYSLATNVENVNLNSITPHG